MTLFGHQVQVVAHQAPAQEAHRRVFAILPQPPKVGTPIIVARKRFPTIYTTLRHVAGHPRQQTSFPPRHRSGL
jgi:hypothetical protein